MSFGRNSKNNIIVARSHLVFQAYLKDNILPKSKNILLLCNVLSLGAKRDGERVCQGATVRTVLADFAVCD